MRFSKLLFILTVSALISLPISAQDKIEYKPSKDFLIEGYKKLGEGEYEAAIKAFEQVYEGDSLFFSYSLPSLMISYISLEDYEKVKELGDKYWFFRHKLPTEFYLSYGTALDKLEEFEQAELMYKSILEEFPMNYSLWYNLGVSLSLAGKHEEAYEAYKKTVTINPLYDRVHHALALMALNEKQTTKAIMAMGMYLVLSAEKRNNLSQLAYADEISSTKYWTSKDFEGSDGLSLEGNSEFNAIDQLVHNYIALDNKYKTPSKLSFPFIKQSHLIFSQLEDIKIKDDNFWHKTYVAFYKDVMSQKKFPGYSYLISLYVESSHIQGILMKNKKHIVDFLGWSKKNIDTRNEYIDFDFLGYGKQRVVRESEYYYTAIIGDFKKDATGNAVDGDLTFFNSAGRLTAEGRLNNLGKKEGEWKYYHTNGYLKEIVQYKNDIAHDTSYTYFDNGLLQYKVFYMEGKISGDVYIHDNGVLKRIVPYKDNQLGTGKLVEYYACGTVYYEYNIVDGKYEGNFVTYYSTGETYKTGTYKADMYEGEQLTYYKNGKLKEKEFFKNDEPDGLAEEYYSDGQLLSTGNYLNGKKTGKWTSYYSNGSIFSIRNFDEDGKENGTEEYYTIDGWKQREFSYKKGEIVGYKAFDKNGNVLAEDIRKGGDFYYKSFHKNGNIENEGTYGKKEKTGVWKNYDENGNLYTEEEFRNGIPRGMYKQYFSNGVLESQYAFNSKGEMDGYFEDYYRNGKLYRQGYLRAGDIDGPWIRYYTNQTQNTYDFYIDGKSQGYSIQYSVVGLPVVSSYYEDDLLMFTIYHDTLGIPFDTIYETPGHRIHTSRKCETCPTIMEVPVYNNVFHGTMKLYFPNGQIASTGEMYNNNRHGKWVSYHYNGKISGEFEYDEGKRVGTWSFYDENGQLADVAEYKNSVIHGMRKLYEDGIIKRTTMYNEEQLHGESVYYINGKQDHVRIYDEGILIKVKYILKGKTVEIDIKNETADIEIFWSNGKPARTLAFKNGKLEGEYMIYYETGQLASISTYVNGWEHGVEKKYYPDGKLKEETPYVNGSKHGTAYLYHPNGSVKEDATYVLDELHGFKNVYDIKGTVIWKLRYYDGELIEML